MKMCLSEELLQKRTEKLVFKTLYHISVNLDVQILEGDSFRHHGTKLQIHLVCHHCMEMW